MSSKEGTVIPGFTRTFAPAAKRAGVRGRFSFLLFLLMAAPPVSLLIILRKDGPGGQGPAGILPVTGTHRQANASKQRKKEGVTTRRRPPAPETPPVAC